MGPADEGRHLPPDDPVWTESWYFDWAGEDGSLAGYVRLVLLPAHGLSWFWACLVGEGRPLVTVLDHDAPLPRAPGLDVRGEGLWVALECEQPLDHWTVGLEAFGLAFDDPREVLGRGHGDRAALGLDLEWETDSPVGERPDGYWLGCRVSGEVLVGPERLTVDGWGLRDHTWGRAPWSPWAGGRLADGTWFRTGDPAADGLTVEPLRRAPVRLDGPAVPAGVPTALDRALSRYRTADGRTGLGWAEGADPPFSAR